MANSYAEFISKPISEKVTLTWIEPAERLLDWSIYSGSIYQRNLDHYIIYINQDGQDANEVNSIGELVEGSWFFDSSNKIVYYWAFGSIDPHDEFTVATYRIPFSNKPVILPIGENGREIEYLPLIGSSSRYSTKLDNEDQVGIALESGSSIDMIHDGEFWTRWYDNLIWENKSVQIFSWSPELSFNDKKLYFKGIIQDKNISDRAVTFQVKDFLNKLRETIPLPLFSEADGTLPDSLIGRAKRRIYGRVSGLKCTSLNRILDGYQLTGTITGAFGDITIYGTGTNFLSQLSKDDRVIVGEGEDEQEFNVDRIISETEFTIGDEIEAGFQDVSAKVDPEIKSMQTGYNTDHQIAHHALRSPETTISEVIQFNRIKLNDSSDIFEGALVTFDDLGVTRTVKRVTVGNVIVLTQTLPSSPAIGSIVRLNPVQSAFIQGKSLRIDRDYSVDNQINGSKLILDPLVEFNLAPTKKITGASLTFTNGSRTVTGTGVDFTQIFKPRDWVRPDDVIQIEWNEVLQVISESELEIRTPYSEPTIIAPAERKEVNPIGDETILTVDCFGKTKDGLPNGEFIKTASDAVRDILEEANLGGVLNASSFDQADIDMPYTLSLPIPLEPESSAPKIREIISIINNSVFGSLKSNENFDIEYQVLTPEKPNILPTQSIKDDDVISWSLRTTSQNIIRDIIGRYRHQDADRFTGLPASNVLEYTNEFVQRVVETDRLEEIDIYLYDQKDAQIIVERKGFINEISQSIITIKTDLKYALFSIGDFVLLDFDRLYVRYGTEDDTRKIGIISGIDKTGEQITLEVDDLGNIWNRCANIADNTALDYDSADSNERILNGYITDSDELISNASNPKITYRLNLIS